jgi:phospholipid/cholesterol/gamma-HCH transport system permease protein
MLSWCPRVIAPTFVALVLYSVVAVVGLFGSYFFVVFVQNVTPGAFVAGMTLLTGLLEPQSAAAVQHGIPAGSPAAFVV